MAFVLFPQPGRLFHPRRVFFFSNAPPRALFDVMALLTDRGPFFFAFIFSVYLFLGVGYLVTTGIDRACWNSTDAWRYLAERPGRFLT